MEEQATKKVWIVYIMTLLFCIATGIILLCTDAKGSAAPAFSAKCVATTLIIDPGHGGADGGAVAPDGTKESEINLAICLKMKALSDLLGLNNVIIRENESLPYPKTVEKISEKKVWDQKRRVELINSMPDAVLISVHQNFYPDPRPSGPQVLFSSVQGSKELGELCHNALNEALSPDNRRVAAPISDKIYLMKNVYCPAILVECGFMSNTSELKMLLENSYQIKIAAILLTSYLAYIG